VGAKPGGQRHYSDAAIEMALTVRAVYGLALRQTEGFLRSVARILQLDIEIPDHTTLSRRSSTLKVHVRNLATTQASTATNEIRTFDVSVVSANQLGKENPDTRDEASSRPP
jgi:hypothetical protein